MTEKFHKELAQLVMNVVEMGHLAKEMMEKAVNDLKNQTPDMEWFEEKKRLITEMDERIEVKALQLVALHQPMARDLREIAASLKIITYITRIGMYAKDISKISEILGREPHIAKLVSIPHMAQLVIQMLDDALGAFERKDVSNLNACWERDDAVDQLLENIIRESITYMLEDPKNINRCMRYIMVARYLERCGDHACKMAEKIYYMVTGERKER
ncbi:MAG: phosphate signaling complex protein PhoU [Candidatus Thermoplasmatota archaeon]